MILPKPALQVARIQNANRKVFIRVSPSQGYPVATSKRWATHEDLLVDSVPTGSKVIVWEQNGNSCGGIVKSFNAQVGLHEIDFGNEGCENLEIHDMLSLRTLKKWVLEKYRNNELFKKK